MLKLFYRIINGLKKGLFYEKSNYFKSIFINERCNNNFCCKHKSY